MAIGPEQAEEVLALNRPTAYAQWGKRIFDVAAAGSALVVALPVLAVVALTLLVAQGWPVFFSQLRPGRGERPCRLFKFRTMSEARDELW